MKCIWRILLAVVTAGLSEVMRHKSHDKSIACPDQPLEPVEVGTLSVGDSFMKATYHFVIYDIDDTKVFATCHTAGVDVALRKDALVYRL